MRTLCSPNTTQKYVLHTAYISSGLTISQTYKSSSLWQRQLTRSVPSRGLRNPGSWCYHNSVFQALLHAPKVVDWLNEHRDDCSLANCLACSLASFCIQYVRHIPGCLPQKMFKVLLYDSFLSRFVLAFHFAEIVPSFESIPFVKAPSAPPLCLMALCFALINNETLTLLVACTRGSTRNQCRATCFSG